MTDLRKAAEMALNALEFSLPAIEDFGSKEQLTDCHRAIMALYKSIAQPEQEFYPDWDMVQPYHDRIAELEAALAQPEQEEPLPLVDIGVDVTPEGTHVVACYNRPDAVQEMFYSQFHPLAKPEQEPVCDKDPFYCWSIRCQVGKVCKHAAQPEQESISTNDHLCAMLRQVHDVLACTALPMKRPWVGLTGLELNHIFAANVGYPERMCRAIEAALRSKNEY